MWCSRMSAALLAVALLPVLAGCSSARHDDAEAAVIGFYDAYQHHDGARACSLLSPATRAGVEQSSGTSCASGLMKEKVPQAGHVTATSVYGHQAQVRLADDTAFAAEFPGGWKVVAVGCTAHPGLPYDCEVEAG